MAKDVIHPLVIAELKVLAARANLAHERAQSRGKGTNYASSGGAAHARQTRELSEIADSLDRVLALVKDL